MRQVHEEFLHACKLIVAFSPYPRKANCGGQIYSTTVSVRRVKINIEAETN
jgi:hypothetical protein